jgi:multiple sugar transport system substrate-binding protein
MILERSARIAVAGLVAMLVSVASASMAAEPKVVQIWGLPEQDTFEGWVKVLDEYDEAHPEMTILRGSPGGQIPNGIDPQKLMTSVVAGTPPDLIWADRFQLASWAARGVFMPLDELYARDGVDRRDFYPACLNECVYKGKTYGLPWDTDSRALWVNM